jgi:uncharacterized membrane protein YhaH (DUF805 family)
MESSPAAADPLPAGSSPAAGFRVIDDPRREASRPIVTVWLTFVVGMYALSFACPGGASAFVIALASWRELSVRDFPFPVLLAFSWLANPAFCVGVLALLHRRWRGASRTAIFAIAFGALAVYPGVLVLPWWIWMASFVMLYVAAEICAPQSRGAVSKNAAPYDRDF